MSIRTRLAIAVAVVLLATFTLLGAVLVRSTRATLVAQVDQQIRANAIVGDGDGPPTRGGRPGGGGNPYTGNGGYQPGVWTTPQASVATADFRQERVVAHFVYSPNGALVVAEPCGFADAPKAPPRLPTIPGADVKLLVNRITTTPAVDASLDYRMLVQQGTDGNILVSAASLDRVNAAVSRLTRIFLLGGVGALALATLAAYWLIRRGLRPVDRMVETAAAIAGGDLARRVPDADPRTELGRLGGALNEMLHQIEDSIRVRARSEERLRRFIGDAAHELRTPLTSVQGYAELYRQGAIPDAAGVGNAMGRIEAEGSRMARLVDEMLLLARLDQQHGLERQTVDLTPLVREAAEDFRVVAPDRPLTEDLAPGAVVSGDPLRLRQVVDNLLVNARTHTPPGTPVHVRVRAVGDAVQCSVADDGPGIGAEEREHIFERFWRADPARARNRGGSGLGLSIVASIVEAHGGTVTVESGVGNGATFIVRLPVASPEATMHS